MHHESIEHLRRVDPVLGGIIARVGECRLEPRREGTHFDALVRAIVYQQLSGKAAATIHGRMQGLFGGRAPLPAELAAMPDERLREAGLSRQKLGYIKDLATRVASGELPLDASLDAMPDDEIIARLVRVKGIGRWTVQMFLLFRLGRPDVLPELDLGVQNAIRKAYNKRKRVGPKDVLAIGARWRPHASVAAWYLWRSLDVAMSERKTSAAAKRLVRKRPAVKRAPSTRSTAKRPATKRPATKRPAAKRPATKRTGTQRGAKKRSR